MYTSSYNLVLRRYAESPAKTYLKHEFHHAAVNIFHAIRALNTSDRISSTSAAKDAPVIGKDIEKSDVHISVRDGAKICLCIYKPVFATKDALLFFNIHGGGFVLGQPETEEAQNRLIALRNQARKQADSSGNTTYPTPLNDSYDAFRRCLQNDSSLGINPAKIFVGGGSAGANIGILGQVLNIPVTCNPACFPSDRSQYQSFAQNANSPIVDSAKMQWFWKQYLSGCEKKIAANPHVSPLLASSRNLANLPPTSVIQVADKDPLCDEGLAYSEALKQSGVPVTVRLYSGLPHAFYTHPDFLESVECLQTIVIKVEKTTKEDSK